ncbi:transient-receptor-potential-like protein isoform X3 [Anneissia japonica]|uniref:transient-receptor-potential-like protein isoform X3 n=1 Tax=Anneissia japonica TaxID=1529436 RepID=UPI0014255BC8|nr:transient-receptor-potential-like protein isoform X3 [Anneissia japonica]
MNDGDIIDLPVNDRFLKAVKDGEISDIEYILNNKDTNELNINHRDKKGRNALVIAVNNGTLLIIKTLLKHGINVGDSLLRAVESQFFEAVVLICNHTKSHPEDREAIIECHTENDDFHPDITPIILASHHNNYKIIKVLLKYGSTIPDPDTSDFLRTEKHTLQRSVGTLNIYRALASEAYISLTSTDPIGTAFSMCDRLRSLSNQEYEFRAEYNELAEQMEQYAADILGQARSSEESSTVLTHQEDKLYDVIDQGLDHCQLYKVFEAINVEQKKFVAHPHCQQLLIKRFYGQFSSVRDWGTISQLGFSLTVMVLFPILSIIYLFCPTRRLKFTIRTPYIKFLMDVGSKMYFLSFVLMTTAVSKPITEVDADLDDQNFSQLPNWLLGIILAFVLGLTWHELKQVYVSGWQRFKNDGQNFMDFVLLVLYWSYLMLTLMSYLDENSDTEWKFARAKMWGRFLQLRDTVPPPFNVIPSVKWMRVFWHNLRFEWCITRAAYRRRNQSKHRDVQSAEQQYLLIIKQLVTRYITEKTTTTGDTEAGVSRADVINIKNDLAVFRYETFKMLTNQEKAFVSLNTRYNEIREQLQKVDDVYNKTTDLDTNVQELRDRTLEIRETVDDMTMSLLPGSSRRSTSNL